MQQPRGCEPVNRDVVGNPKSGPLGRRGSLPGDAGMKYRIVGLESWS